jgi:hypothetical protein
MPLQIEAILSNTTDRYDRVNCSDFWVIVSGVTPGSKLSGGLKDLPGNSYNIGSITAPHGYSVGSTTSRALVPIVFTPAANAGGYQLNVPYTAGIVITDISTNETVVANSQFIPKAVESTWTISQDLYKNCNITCTSIGYAAQSPLLLSYERLTDYNSVFNQGIPKVYQLQLISPSGATVYQSGISILANGSLPSVQIPNTLITTSGIYTALIKTRLGEQYSYISGSTSYTVGFVDSTKIVYRHQSFQATLTAPSLTSSPTTGLYAWLNSDYWYLTDLQVNAATRAVTHRTNQVSILPNDTVQFAVLFHNGTSGIDPIATDIKIAARSSTNNGPYVLWSAATVTTASINGDTYYAITVTASDEDLLSGQNAQLMSGSNADQSLVAQIQWTTTRGTFSSNQFTINVRNEVVRDMEA